MSPSAKLIVLTAPFTEMIEFYEGRPLQIKTRAELLVAIRPNYWKFFREEQRGYPHERHDRLCPTPDSRRRHPGCRVNAVTFPGTGPADLARGGLSSAAAPGQEGLQTFRAECADFNIECQCAIVAQVGMSKMTGGLFVWACPQCSRRVPNHVVVCRCGHQRTAEIASLPAALAADVGPRRQRVPWALIWSGISMVLLAMLAVQWSSSDTTRPGAAPSSGVSLEISEAQAAAAPLWFAPVTVPTEQPPVAPMPEVRVPSVGLRRPALGGRRRHSRMSSARPFPPSCRSRAPPAMAPASSWRRASWSRTST